MNGVSKRSPRSSKESGMGDFDLPVPDGQASRLPFLFSMNRIA